MELIDEEGNLLGVVNVIDALTVLLLLAVVIAGATFVGVFGDASEERKRYVTVDLGEHPDYVAAQVSEGDVMAPSNTDENLTVTDVYVTPTGNDTVAITIRAEVEGVLVESGQRASTFEFAGTLIRPGTSLTVDTLDYELDGTVVSMAAEGRSLSTEERTVTLQTELSAVTARQLTEGDTYDITGASVATLDSVTVYPTSEPDTRRAVLEVRLQTIQRDGTARFGETPMKLGASLPFRTDGYSLSGTVIARGALSEQADAKTITAVVKLENVSPEQAQAIDAGMTERIDGTTNAEIVDKRVEPAVTILTSEDGDIFQREHPRNKDVYLTVELSVHETSDGYRFHGKRLRVSEDVSLDFKTLLVQGTVVEISG